MSDAVVDDFRLPAPGGWFDMRILGGISSWRWQPTAEDRAWVERAHGQTLEQINAVRGMYMVEIAAMLCNCPCKQMPYEDAERQAIAELQRRGTISRARI